MGAGVSTEGAPLSEVAIKNEIGVLYDAEKKRAFDAAATEGPDGTRVVAWPAIEAYAHDNDERMLDPRKCMFHNLKAFKAAREQIAEIARVHIKGAVREIPWVGKSLGDDCRQCGPDGEPAVSLDALYEVAKLARVQFEEIMTAACPDGVTLDFAPLKGRDRADAKARDEYADKTAPCYSWLFDITRGAALCQTEDALVSLYKALEADDRVDIVRTKNRFAPPLFNGYQDILMNVAVKVENVSHLCELQVHLKAIKDSEPMHKSHLTYEFFRSYFLGNAEAVEERLKLLMALPVDEANDVGELVDHVLRDFEDEAPYRANALYWGDDDRRELAFASDWKLLDGLCELLVSIQESSGVVRVREAWLAEMERAFGAKSMRVGRALYMLGLAYGHLGDATKKLAVLERALPIYEREYGSDHTEVAEVLNALGLAYMGLGEYAKQRDVLERALPLFEREHGKDSTEVAKTLNNLGCACGELGNHAKKRDMLERALAIQERAYGRDHPAVASTLTNLGRAYGDLGDQAKKRDMLERALAIKERAYGRDHAEVAFPLANIGMLCRTLGDQAKAREYFGRAHAIWERAYGPEHQLTQQARAYLDDARSDLKFPLHAAAKGGDVDAITRLLDDGAEIDTEISGETPLYFACQEGHVDAARLLLDKGADVHRRAGSGHTCLNVACYCGHVEVVQLLLDNGAVADLNVADEGGDTPQANAESEGHSAVVDLLEKYTS